MEISNQLILINSSPIVNEVACVEQLTLKGVKDYLSTNIKPYFTDMSIQLVPFLFTLNMDTTISYTKAWENSQYYRNLIFSIILDTIPDVHLVISTIEHTHKITLKHSGKLKEKKSLKKSTNKEIEEEKAYNEDSIYCSKTLIDLQNIYDKDYKTISNDVDDIYLPEYTIALYNFFSELIYVAKFMEKDDSLVFWAHEHERKIRPYIDDGLDFPFEYDLITVNGIVHKRYKPNIWLYLAYKQIKSGTTTLGYPHFHFVIYIDSVLDTKKLELFLNNKIRNGSPFLDIRVESSKVYGDPDASMAYVFKNHSSKVVVNSLKRAGQSPEIIQTCITSKKHYMKLHEFMYTVSNPIKKTFNPASKTNKSISMNIYTTKKVLDINSTPQINNLITSNIKLVDPDINKTFKYIRFVQDIMIKENLSICDGVLYVKNLKSKNTWLPHKRTIEQFINDTTRDVDLMRIAGTTSIKIIEWMKNPSNMDFLGREKIQFPTITMDYDIIEFKDFWYSITTCKIYKSVPKNYVSHLYVANISLLTFENTLRDLIVISLWIKQLKSSFIYYIEVIAKLYEGLQFRDIRNGVLTLIGPPRSGKTSILLPFLLFYPEHLIGYITEFNKFNLFDNALGKRLSMIDDGNVPLRNASKGSARNLALNALAGDKCNIEGKFKSGQSIDFRNNNFFITLNEEKEDILIIRNEALMDRLYMAITYKNEDYIIKAFEEAAAKSELPIIILFSGMCYMSYKNNIEYIPNIIICESLEEEKEDLDIIETVRKSRRGERIEYNDEDSDIFIYSKNAQKLKTTINTTPFICEDLPKRSIKTQKHIIKEIEEHIMELNGLKIKDISSLSSYSDISSLLDPSSTKSF